MTVARDYVGRGSMVVDLTGVASTDAGGQGEIDNPEGVTLLITRVRFQNVTPSTGASNLSAGVALTGVSATDVLNALDMNGVAAGSWYNGFAPQDTAKTEITAPALWTAAKKITFSASASMVGYTGKVYIDYKRI